MGNGPAKWKARRMTRRMTKDTPGTWQKGTAEKSAAPKREGRQPENVEPTIYQDSFSRSPKQPKHLGIFYAWCVLTDLGHDTENIWEYKATLSTDDEICKRPVISRQSRLDKPNIVV